MKRLFAVVAFGMALMLFAACGPSSPDGETTNQETPTATVEIEFDFGALMSELIEEGGAFGLGDDVTQPFFSVTGQTLMVKEEAVQVFIHDSPAAAQAEADLVDPAGFTVGTTSISWVAPPHFYLKDSLLVLYVGGNGPVIEILETIMGPQFAGADSSTVEPNSYADDEVRTYLTLMNELESYLRAYTSGRSTPEFATESIITVASQLEGYTKFFTELEGEQADYVFETYAEEFRRSTENVAGAATAIQEDGGNEVIAQALARIPAFAIASVTSSGPGDPVTAPAGYIGALLLPDEVADLAGGVHLTTMYRDQRSMVAKADPAEVEYMVSFDSLDFVVEDTSQSLTLMTIEFDSEGAASDHVAMMTSETLDMQAHSVPIEDASFYAEVNESAFGSMVLFKKGSWVVTLHTAQPDGTSPLVDLAGLEALARIVADRL